MPRAMPDTPRPVLIADDGDLEEVREALDGLGIPWLEASARRGEPPEAVSLLVTNTRHALARGVAPPTSSLHLVLYDARSRGLRRVLERSGCDLALERPLASHTLALVAAQALYAGPERRRGPRVVMSAPVELRAAGASEPATLVELSLRGCGLLALRDPGVGREICVLFPPELTQGAALEASGPALSVVPAGAGAPERRIAMAFRLMNGPSRRVIAGIMERLGAGAELRPRMARPALAPAELPRRPGERREGARRPFEQRVLAAGVGMSHLLIGCDLSTGGMRVRPDTDLALGDELRLAIHSRPGLPAIMVKAVVTRDDGAEGVLLRFHDVPPSIAARLEQIVDGLPSAAARATSSARSAPGVVVSEILDRE
jgi:hypothetical protein